MSLTADSLYTTTALADSWASTITVEPLSRATVKSRLNDLLAGKSINSPPGVSSSQTPKDMLSQFVLNLQLESNPAAFDDIWHAIFDVAKAHGWTEHIREQTYYWTEQYLLNVAWDALSEDEGEENQEGQGQEYDNSWITCAMGDARLFALGYGYSAFAWNALIDGLGLGGEERNSDSMRLGSCAQLLGAGRRIKLHLLGGGEDRATPGFAGRYLDAQPPGKRAEWEKNGAETWATFLRALVEEQSKAGPRASSVLKATYDHLASDVPDLTSAEVANIIWPRPKE